MSADDYAFRLLFGSSHSVHNVILPISKTDHLQSKPYMVGHLIMGVTKHICLQTD